MSPAARGYELLHPAWHTHSRLLLAVLFVGCRTGAAPGTAPPQAAACILADDTARSSISFALSEPVDPAHAPVPANAAEGIVFRQLYETLLTLDCDGRIVAGLAESWAATEGGRVWEFRLRANATFWDGQPVTASAVQDSWNAHAGARNSVTTVLDARRLRVQFFEDTVDASLFAHPAFAVARRDMPAGWRIGSGLFRPDLQDDVRVIAIRRRDARAEMPASIVFQAVSGSDLRRSLDGRVAALISDHRAVLDYARALPGYTSVPLPWSQTYALASHAAGVAPPADALAALARDAVPGDARATNAAVACLPQPPASTSALPFAPSIIYARDDAAARGIAERIVALSWPVARAPEWLRSLLPPNYGTAGVPIARGIDRAAVVDSLRTRRALAYVVSLPRDARASCDGDAPIARALLDSRLSVTPLVDTRAYLIHRSGLGRVAVDGDGVIRFTSRVP
jgi:hypothetical protein